jgi:hypothetical protein
MKFNLTIQELKTSERSVYSQGGQDGVLNAIFNQIGIEHYCCMEFGARDGFDLSNTANLAINKNFRRILVDAEPKAARVSKAFITKDNINDIVNPSYQLDYLSIDLDGNDYWVWEAIENKPRVVSIEFNSKFRNDESVAIEYNENHTWDGDDYYGASLAAMKKLGNEKGYTLVHRVSALDAFFVRNDLIDENYTPPTLDELLPKPIIAFEKVSNKKWIEV